LISRLTQAFCIDIDRKQNMSAVVGTTLRPTRLSHYTAVQTLFLAGAVVA